jgi:putative DNA primase/helicase
MTKKAKKIGRGRTAPDFSLKIKKRPKLLQRALKYASDGWPVVPMHTITNGHCTCHKGSHCTNPGKHPATPHGVKDATTKRKKIRQWWSDMPNANVGVATGKNAGLVVLDIDPRNDGLDTLKRLEADLGALPRTVTSETGGGGQHLMFAYPSAPIRKDSSGKLLGPGVDVLSDKTIMVAPPSRHATGQRYIWTTGQSPDEVSVASLPDKWVTKLAVRPSQEINAAKGRVVVGGARNDSLTSIAGVLQRSGLSAEAMLVALRAENKAHCSPPLSDDEVRKVAKSVSRYALGSEGDRGDEAEKLVDLVLHRHFEDGKHLLFGANGQFWRYTGKMWTVAQDKWIEGRILASAKVAPFKVKQNTSSLVAQVYKLLAAQLSSETDRLGILDDPPSVINCSNCEVWILPDGTIEQRPHQPESYLRHCLDVKYDPAAKCSEYDKALLGIFAKTSSPKEMRKFWNELVGYIIQPRRNIATIAILLGSGNNGKTALVKTITKLLGKAQVHAQRVEDLERNKFAFGSLFGKLLFLDDDVKAGARLPDGTLKIISEAKEVTGENKYKDPFNFVVRSVPMLLCNNVPSLADLSRGMLRRLIVIPFDRSFTDKDEDKELFDRIRANELSGVLNKALKGYIRLQKRQRFKLPKAVKQAQERWLEQANPLPAFISECCVKGPNRRCLRKGLYKKYHDWASEAGYTLFQNEKAFVRNLEHLSFHDVHGNQGQTIVGLDLK